jgi:hypothetical protein
MAWTEELTPEEVELIEWTCAEPMQGLGYEPTTAARRPGWLAVGRLQRARIGGIIGQIGHYRRHRRGYLAGLVRRKALLRAWRI